LHKTDKIAWGTNDYGEIGNGGQVFPAVYIPTQIGSANNWASISAGDHIQLH
jgi:hypothetical protein